MAWYYGKYSCGHEGRVNVIGKMSERQWKIDRHFSGICEECRKKENEQKALEASKKAKEYEFPKLNGSEKQIQWAETLRMKFYEYCDKNKIDSDDIISNETESRFWIDNRAYLCHEEFVMNYKKQKEKEQQIKEMIDNDTVKPSEVKHDGVVEIVENDGYICLKYEKDQDFIDLVRSHRYRWNGRWCRKLSEMVGTFKDRAAEIGYFLLKNGFCICIHDKEILDCAIKGKYEPECDNWISSKADSTELNIIWDGKNDTLYHKAKAIKGAYWSSPCISVDVCHYDEIEKFAEENGFRFTTKAREKISQYIKELENIKEVDVK